jgi:hypothetical protein
MTGPIITGPMIAGTINEEKAVNLIEGIAIDRSEGLS